MKTVPVTGNAKSFKGKSLTDLFLKDGKPNTQKEIPFAGEYSHYDHASELREAGAWPNDAQVVKFVNTANKNKARANASNKAIEDAGIVAPTMENDPQMRLEAAFDVVMSSVPANKRNDEATILEARARATAFTGIEWEDED